MNRFQRLRRRALAVGLDISTYSPGDGCTRFKFHRVEPRLVSDPAFFGPPPHYHGEDGLGRAAGFGSAEAWVEAYGMGWFQGGMRNRPLP